MSFSEAFNYILLNVCDIERVANDDYLYEVDMTYAIGRWVTLTEEQVIEFAEKCASGIDAKIAIKEV